MNVRREFSDGAALRSRNVARVLTEIRRKGEVARVDIADALSLSPATVTAVIADLIATGLIEEAEAVANAGRGRPRVLLRLRSDALYVAGAKLADNRLTVAIMNFAGEILGDGSAPLEAPRISVADMAERLDAALKPALAAAQLERSDIAALGLGLPGFVDVETGRCHWSPIIKDTPVDLRASLSTKLSCPIFIDNDANLATVAELWFGLGKNETNFIVVTIENGVGMGVVIDGSLYRGSRGLGAEFGHTKIQNEGALCRCGQRGCVEAYVADYALVREAGAALGPEDVTADQAKLLRRLSDRAEAGDDVSASIYRRAGRMLGIGLSNLINIFDPPLVILSGERMRFHHLMSDEMAATIAANSLRTDLTPPRIAVHRWGDTLWARGAGALALDGITSSASVQSV